MFLAQAGERQVRAKTELYVLEGLSTDVILSMDFLQRYNPSSSWVDSLVGMPCLIENEGVCQSSSNFQGSHMDGHSRMTSCNNSMLCKKKVLILAI